MSHVEPFRIGDVEVSVVCQGFAPMSLNDECPDGDVDWDAERGLHPWAFVGANAWPWHVHAFALRSPAGLVMVDTGLGAYPPYRPWGEHRPAARAYATEGIDPADVQDVVLTHLHADHAGGSVLADGAPRFRNAVYHVHPADWSFFARSDDPDDYHARRSLLRIAELGMLDLDPTDREVTPGVRLIHTPGHTPGHRSVVISDGDETLLVTGDLLHLPFQVAHPDRHSTHDEDPAQGSASRKRELAHARDGMWHVAVPHFARPFGRVDAWGWQAY